ncbi:MAG: T9SS type A sorting domain-containing protein [Chitinophagaceae bacterium]|nr:T9SS type A sorting domain-containing protein [Chitinophagaceae bacterium]
MKKNYSLFLFFFFLFSVSNAQLYEDFNYTAGDNVGGNCAGSSCNNNNWTTHSNGSSTTGTINVVSGSLSYSGLASSSGNRINIPGNNTTTPRDINRPTQITGSPTVAYFSFLLNVIDNTQLGTSHGDNGYFIHFGNTSGSSVTILFGRVSARSVNSGSNYRLGIQNTSGTGANYTDVPVDLNFNETYLVVVKYDFNGSSNDIATIWVNPTSLGGSEPAGGISNQSSSSTSPTTFASICIRNSSATPNAFIDEIRTGTTWASVTPTGTLPVKLIHFSGFRKENQNVLRWTTSHEQQNDGFYIMRSDDGIHFAAVGFVKSKAAGGNSDSPLYYEFTDQPLSGNRHYYRLAQQDLNGSQKLSSIIVIYKNITEKDGWIEVYPNPSHSTANIKIISSKKENWQLNIIDAAGRIYLQKNLISNEGVNVFPLSIEHLPPGTYQFSLKQMQNGFKKTIMVLKKINF